MTEPTVFELTAQTLRKQRRPLTLGALAGLAGIPANQISAAICKAMAADPNCGVERVERGVYRWVETPVPGDTPAEEPETTQTRAYHPPSEEAREAGRVRKVRRIMSELRDALGELDRYVEKIERKARAYDKVQLTINGRIEDPL